MNDIGTILLINTRTVSTQRKAHLRNRRRSEEATHITKASMLTTESSRPAHFRSTGQNRTHSHAQTRRSLGYHYFAVSTATVPTTNSEGELGRES